MFKTGRQGEVRQGDLTEVFQNPLPVPVRDRERVNHFEYSGLLVVIVAFSALDETAVEKVPACRNHRKLRSLPGRVADSTCGDGEVS
jgi:hypothetical protein